MLDCLGYSVKMQDLLFHIARVTTGILILGIGDASACKGRGAAPRRMKRLAAVSDLKTR